MKIAKLLPALALVLAIWAWQEWPARTGATPAENGSPAATPAMTSAASTSRGANRTAANRLATSRASSAPASASKPRPSSSACCPTTTTVRGISAHRAPAFGTNAADRAQHRPRAARCAPRARRHRHVRRHLRTQQQGRRGALDAPRSVGPPPRRMDRARRRALPTARPPYPIRGMTRSGTGV